MVTKVSWACPKLEVSHGNNVDHTQIIHRSGRKHENNQSRT